jgi:hypothetical protein
LGAPGEVVGTFPGVGVKCMGAGFVYDQFADGGWGVVHIVSVSIGGTVRSWQPRTRAYVMERGVVLHCYLPGGPVCADIEGHVDGVVGSGGCSPCWDCWLYFCGLVDEGLGCCRVDDLDLFGCIDCWGLDELTECVVGIVCFLVFEGSCFPGLSDKDPGE